MTSRVVVSIRVPCSPIQAFEVFTEEIGEWWSYDTFFKLTPRSPGVMAFEPPDDAGRGGRLVEKLPDGKVFEVGPIRAWSPGQRLVVGWRQATFGPDHATEVEVRFEPVGAETRVTVEHRGWDSVAQDHVARHGFPLLLFNQRQGEYWRNLLSRLKDRTALRKPRLD
jgi:Activator of Hsp90 ATPase homolog 1-like protein